MGVSVAGDDTLGVHSFEKTANRGILLRNLLWAGYGLWEVIRNKGRAFAEEIC